MSACGNYAITELSPIKAFMFEAKVASVSSQIKDNSIIKSVMLSAKATPENGKKQQQV